MEYNEVPEMQMVRERIDLADGKTCHHLLEQRYALLLEQISKSLVASFAHIETDVVPLLSELLSAAKEGRGLIEHADCCDPALAKTVDRLSDFIKDLDRLMDSYSRLLVT